MYEQRENINESNDTVQAKKSFDFEAINQRVAMGAPQNLMSQLKSVPYDLMGVTKYTIGYIFAQVFALLTGLLSIVGVAAVLMFAEGDDISGDGAEYVEYIREMLLAANLEFIVFGLIALFCLVVSFLFKKKGKVKDWFVLSQQGIYLYRKGHLDLLSWDRLEPLVRVSGKSPNATIIYKFKMTIADQIANAMNNMKIPTQMNSRSIGSRVGRSYGRSVQKQSPKLFKLHGVEHPTEILEVSNHYLHSQ